MIMRVPFRPQEISLGLVKEEFPHKQATNNKILHYQITILNSILAL